MNYKITNLQKNDIIFEGNIGNENISIIIIDQEINLQEINESHLLLTINESKLILLYNEILNINGNYFIIEKNDEALTFVLERFHKNKFSVLLTDNILLFLRKSKYYFLFFFIKNKSIIIFFLLMTAISSIFFSDKNISHIKFTDSNQNKYHMIKNFIDQSINKIEENKLDKFNYGIKK